MSYEIKKLDWHLDENGYDTELYTTQTPMFFKGDSMEGLDGYYGLSYTQGQLIKAVFYPYTARKAKSLGVFATVTEAQDVCQNHFENEIQRYLEHSS